MMMNRIIHGDCLEVLPKLPRAKMIFADPPDNLGMKYNGFEDRWPSDASYIKWLADVTEGFPSLASLAKRVGFTAERK
jgi:DNA modification methylase